MEVITKVDAGNTLSATLANKGIHCLGNRIIDKGDIFPGSSNGHVVKDFDGWCIDQHDSTGLYLYLYAVKGDVRVEIA